MPDNIAEIGSAVQKSVAAKADAVRDRGSRLLDDLRTVIGDAERLLRTAGDASRDGWDSARSQLEQTVAEARERLLDAEDAARARLSRAAYATNDYISANPLRALLIAASVGAVVAWLMTRDGDGDDGHEPRDYEGGAL